MGPDPVSVVLELLTAAVAALFAVAVVAKYPTRAVAVAVPVLMWPALYRAGPVALQQALAAILAVGLCGAGLKAASRTERRLVLAAGLLTVLLLASHYLHAPPNFIETSEARNSMFAVVINVWLLVGVARSRPRPVVVLHSLGVGALLFSGYVLAYGQMYAGRIDLEGLNPNSAGHAAALGILSLLAAARMTGHRWWLVTAIVPAWLLYQSQSRGALVVLIAGLMLAWILSHRGGAPRAVAVLAGISATLLLWGPASRFTQDSLLAERSAAFVSTDARKDVLRIAWDLIKSNPVFGIGYGTFPDQSLPVIGLALNTHDDWVRIAVEAGVPAMLLLAFIIALPLLRSPSAHVRVLVAAGCVSWLFANVITDLRVALPLWVAAGLGWASMRPRSVVGDLPVGAVDAEGDVSGRGGRERAPSTR